MVRCASLQLVSAVQFNQCETNVNNETSVLNSTHVRALFILLLLLWQQEIFAIKFKLNNYATPWHAHFRVFNIISESEVCTCQTLQSEFRILHKGAVYMSPPSGMAK